MRFPWHGIAALLAALAVLIGSGCAPKAPAEPPSELWLRVHAAGGRALAADTNAAVLRQIAALPSTKELADALAPRLLGALVQHLARNTNAPSPVALGLLRPLLDEALTREFILECYGRTNETTAWLLAVALEGDLARRWESNYTALTRELRLGETKKLGGRSFGGWNLRQTDGRVIDYLEIGKWVIVGFGTDREPMAGVLRRLNERGHAAPPLNGAWLRVEGDLNRFAERLPFGRAFHWPHIALEATGRATNVVLQGKLTLPGPWTAPLPEWNPPTTLMRDPIISFAAARGVHGVLGRLPFYQRLALTNPPNQLFFWAQAQIPFQSHVAAPSTSAGETLHEIERRLPLAMGTNMQSLAFGQFRWATNRVDLIWAGLPVVVPYLRAAKLPEGEFLFGGLFPPRESRDPLPAELLAQLNRPNLVYYDWEITEERLRQWRQLSQITRMVKLQPPPLKSVAHAQWAEAIAPLLGNTVTEFTRTGPREVSFIRKGHLGLTGVEIVRLAGALDDYLWPGPQTPGPRPGLPVPPAPTGKVPPAP